MISLALVLPLMCWALVARTTKVGWIVAAVLAVCLATEIGLAKSWILPGERVTLLVALVLTTIMVLITGITVEGHHADARSDAGCRNRFRTSSRSGCLCVAREEGAPSRRQLRNRASGP